MKKYIMRKILLVVLLCLITKVVHSKDQKDMGALLYTANIPEQKIGFSFINYLEFSTQVVLI